MPNLLVTEFVTVLKKQSQFKHALKFFDLKASNTFGQSLLQFLLLLFFASQ